MSAALQVPFLWAASADHARCLLPDDREPIPAQHLFSGYRSVHEVGPLESAVHHLQKHLPIVIQERLLEDTHSTNLAAPLVSYAFYRKHTEKLLQRYIQASFLIGRSPTLLAESVDQGWASCRKVRTFEDALIFVIDIEKCLTRLSKLDLQMISRVVVQNNTQKEAAALIGISLRILSVKLPEALDRLTENLVNADLLKLPGD